MRVELPGIDPKGITVNVVGDMLTIRALRHQEHETQKRDFLHREGRYELDQSLEFVCATRGRRCGSHRTAWRATCGFITRTALGSVRFG